MTDRAALVAAAQQLAAHGQMIWGQHAATPAEVATLATVVVGDLARAARDGDRAGLVRELGNLLLSSARWSAELGIDPGEAAETAAEAQRRYADEE